MKNANPSIYLTHGYYCSVYGTRLVYQVVCPLSWQGEGAGGGGEIREREKEEERNEQGLGRDIVRRFFLAPYILH